MHIYQYGLICNIVGSIIVCIWGLPNTYYAKDGGTFPTMGVNKEAGLKYNKRKKAKAYLGMILLIIGFGLELYDSFNQPK